MALLFLEWRFPSSQSLGGLYCSLSIRDEGRRTQGDFFSFFLSEQHLKGDFAGERRVAAVLPAVFAVLPVSKKVIDTMED